MYCCIQFMASMTCAFKNGRRVNNVERKHPWITQQNVQCNWYEIWKRKILLCEDSFIVSLLDMENVVSVFWSKCHNRS